MADEKTIPMKAITCAMSAFMLMALATSVSAKTIIRFAGRAAKGTDAYKSYEKAMKDYSKLHPDVTFQYIGEAGHNEYRDKLLTMWASGQEPDVVNLYGSWIIEFANRGLIAPYSADIVSQIKQRYYSSVISSQTYKGKLYALGNENQIHGLAYSKKILAESGIGSVPDTWDDLISLAAKLTVPSASGKGFKQQGFCTELAQWCFTGFFRTLLESRGGQFASRDKLLFNSKEGLSAIKDIREWFGTRRLATGSPWENSEGSKVAFTLAYPFYTIWHPKYKTRMNDILGVALMPKGPSGRYGHHYTWGIAVSAASKQKRTAADFAYFLSTNAGSFDNMTYSGASIAGLALPSNRSDITKGSYIQAGTKDWFTGFAGNLEATNPVQATEPYSEKAEEVMWSELKPCIDGKTSPEVALLNAERKLLAVVKRYIK